MKIPLLPQDKANHYFYGSLASLVTLIAAKLLLLAIAFFGVSSAWHASVLLVYVVAFLASVAVGKAKEIMDQRANDQAIAEGRDPEHSVETNDVRATAAGGFIVSAAFLLGALWT
jgi:hypothetical protein